VPRAFDLVTMRLYDRSWVRHVGVAVDARHVIHTEKNFDSVKVPLDHYTIKHRVAGFHRLKIAP
jgi:hypothetical protein